MAKSFITLDIGERFIKVADVEKRANQLVTSSLAFDMTPANIYLTDSEKDNQNMAVLIEKLLKDAGIRKKNVNVIIPDSYSYSQILEMPSITEKELLSAIKYQADQFIPIPIEKVNLDIEILSEDKKNKKLLILLVAAPLAILDKIASIVETANLSPLLIENETSSSFRLIDFIQQKQQQKKQGGTLYINFGNTSTTLYFFGPNPLEVGSTHIPYQIRNFPVGLEIFVKEVKVNFNLADKDALQALLTVGLTGAQSAYDLKKVLVSPSTEFVEEIKKFIISLKSKVDVPLQEIYLYGEGHVLAGIKEMLTASLNLPVSDLNVSEILLKNNVSEFFKKDLPLFIPSLGGNLAENV